MVAKKITLLLVILTCLLLAQNTTFGAGSEALEIEKQMYKQELTRIKALRKSFKPGPVNDLKEYENFADAIQENWKKRNKEHYAKLMLEVCKPLSSGRFKDDRRRELARQYALSALTDADKISIETELELTGHVVTLMIGPSAPKGQMWEQLRRKDVEIRLHAWRRLVKAIDPTWDPNEEQLHPEVIAAALGLPRAIAPETTTDPKLQAEYKAALQRNRHNIERSTKQSRLHDEDVPSVVVG